MRAQAVGQRVLLGYVLAAMCWSAPADAEGPSGTDAERRYTPAGVQSDLDTMYRRLQLDAFDLYAFTPKPALDRMFRRLRQDLSSGRVGPHGPRPLISKPEAEQRLQLLASAAHLGHARVEGIYAEWAEYRRADGRAFPLTLRIVEGRVYVAKNLSGNAQIRVGDQILAMDGSSADRWLVRTGRHISAETPDLANSILEYDFPMYLWVEAGPKPTFQLTLRTPGRAATKTTIAAATAVEMERNATGQPQGLDLDHPLRDARVLSNGIGYLRPGPFYNDAAKTAADEWDVSAFKAFIDGAFRTFDRQDVKKLIIDLRGNAGGDSLFSDVMVSWFADRPYQFFSSFKVRASADAIAANQDRLDHDAAAAGPISRRFARLYAGAAPGAVLDFDLPPSLPNPTERFAGEVFVLIDRQTYSNAVAVAATIQDNRFGLVMGEPTTDMATAYGAMEHFTLPVTGAVIGFPKARIVRPSGDPRSRGVTPDIPIAAPVIQTAADEVLKRAREIVLHRR
jgi:hypothetical protein